MIFTTELSNKLASSRIIVMYGFRLKMLGLNTQKHWDNKLLHVNIKPVL